MKETAGKVFSIAKENPLIPGCTITKELNADSTYYFLAQYGDIKAERYENEKLIMVIDGRMDVQTDQNQELTKGMVFVIPTDQSVHMSTGTGCIFTMFEIKDGAQMPADLKKNTALALADLIPQAQGSVVNKDLLTQAGGKLCVMRLDAGTELKEHAADGDALLFAVEGEATITYEGKEFAIRHDESFLFAKGAVHALKAKEPFTMVLWMED
ncbi:cupin domain-containing protein [Catenisphaera adipataccumulans]|uniref:Quercetin dioxygenase-like cupin family protein n=1 Tax=Catenisphaera adipataccumulans TaxID=700500 RepID=A0A7W8FV41_9FIRM|nr:cupin domain-containing protein [Catenisphaera adipataccumulans]MBB5182753.1 quercetin dioxygenase-like cupin family protein [Catenisphaera adipataccumulans]